MVTDSDLLSIQQARHLLERARKAWTDYAHFSQEKVDRVVEAASEAASTAALRLAELAVEETGYGVVEHKFLKNKFAAIDVYRYIKDMKTVGVLREIPERRVYEIAEPVGVVAAVVPSTNPTSTAIYKVLIALKARNAVVLSPHPAARRCIAATAEVMAKAAEAAGAPAGAVGCMDQVTLEGTQELMRHRLTSVVLATGGMGLVRAAYSSGKPAFGVGPGNVPAYIESSADVPKAVRDVLTGKSFDNGTLCCSEQALICDEGLAERVRAEVVRQGGYFLSADQIRAVEKVAVTPARLANPEIVGKSAPFIAEKAGFPVPEGTRVLVAELKGVGRNYPLSIEKLAPILAFYVVRDWREGCQRSKEVLSYGGMGHTLSIHSQNHEVVMQFGLEKPAFRIVVNSSATHGAVGFSTGLPPAMTLGCGAYGGNITSDNITPLHLLNIKRLAYEVRPVDIAAALAEYGYPGAAAAPRARPSVEDRVSRYLDSRGWGPRSEIAQPAAAPAADAGKPPLLALPLEFVAEEQVRDAIHEGRKLPVGPRTIVTPAARELGNREGVFLQVGWSEEGASTTSTSS
jgi:acetaldehyde dehydrogenase (acetylating)